MTTGLFFSIASRESAISLWSITFSRPWSCACVWKISTEAGISGLWNKALKSSPLAFQWSTGLRLVEHLHLPDHFVERAIAQFRHQLAHFFSDEEEEVDDMLGLADKALAQHGVLCGDAYGTRVEVALAHHDAAGRNQRRGRKAELVGAKQTRPR